MAERRMFAKSVIESDAFLELPISTRLLYFDLGMRGDDDGFVNSPKLIMRMTGASEDDLRLLIAKQFLIPFESGVVVVRHWKMHNYIRSDRYKTTQYQFEKSQLMEDENGIYCTGLPVGIPSDNQLPTSCLPNGIIGKEGKEGEDIPPISPKGDVSDSKQGEHLTVEIARGAGSKKPVDHAKTLVTERFSQFWGAYPKKVGKVAAEKSFSKLKMDDSLFGNIMTALKRQSACDQWQRDGGQYIPNPATWLNQRRWEDETEAIPSDVDLSDVPFVQPVMPNISKCTTAADLF